MRAENRPILQFRAIIIASRYIYGLLEPHQPDPSLHAGRNAS
jgi:hypothetical protein